MKEEKETFLDYLKDAFVIVAMCFIGWLFMFIFYALGA